MELLTKIYNFLKGKSYIFLVAALVEAPRLVYSFGAFREYWLFALALSLVSTYALSITFEAYFKDTKRILLLILGIFSILINIIIVSPVILYLLTSPNDKVNLVEVFGAYKSFLIIYSITVTLSTFWPLVLIAAVHGTTKEISEPIKFSNNSIPLDEVDEIIDNVPTPLLIEESLENKESEEVKHNYSQLEILILESLKNSPKTLLQLAEEFSIEQKELVNGKRWGLLQKELKGKIKKVGEVYNLV